MKKRKRIVNKKLVDALIAYRGLTHEKLGRLCDPPVTRAAISLLLLDMGGGDRLRNQMGDILADFVNDLHRELAGIQNGNISEILFPVQETKNDSAAQT